jgi:hypothetical protein
MTLHRKMAWTAVVVLGALVFAGSALRADEKKDAGPPWDHSFNGHEMWSMDVRGALAQAAKEGRPMLIDFYKFT